MSGSSEQLGKHGDPGAAICWLRASGRAGSCDRSCFQVINNASSSKAGLSQLPACTSPSRAGLPPICRGLVLPPSHLYPKPPPLNTGVWIQQTWVSCYFSQKITCVRGTMGGRQESTDRTHLFTVLKLFLSGCRRFLEAPEPSTACTPPKCSQKGRFQTNGLSYHPVLSFVRVQFPGNLLYF